MAANALALPRPLAAEQVNGNGSQTPRLIRWLLIGIVITMPYQRFVVFPDLGYGYVSDVLIMTLMVVGWLVIFSKRTTVRFPLLIPHLMILAGSLLGTASGLSRGESLSTLLRDVYVWLFFYTAINLIWDRKLLHTLILIWVAVAIFESFLIFGYSRFTSDRRRPTSANFNEALQGLNTTEDVPALSDLPAEDKQAAHVIKRIQLRTYTDLLSAPGTGIGTFANGDFTANFLAAGIFLALVAPFQGQRGPLRGAAVVVITLGCLLTGVSSQLPIIPIALGVYLLVRGSPRQRLFYAAAGLAAAAVALFVILSAHTLAGVDLLAATGEAESQTLTGGIAGITSGLEDRLALIRDGWQEFRHYPLGVGPHGLRASGLEKNVHNEYAAYLYERGIVGFAGLLLLHAVVVGLSLSSLRSDDRGHRLVMTGLLAAYVMVHLNNLGHELLRQRDVWMLSILVVSYAELGLRQVRVQRRERLARQFPWAYPEPSFSGVHPYEAAGQV